MCIRDRRHTGNQRHLKARELALVKAGIRLEQGQRDDGAKYGIAQKLQAFIASRTSATTAGFTPVPITGISNINTARLGTIRNVLNTLVTS